MRGVGGRLRKSIASRSDGQASLHLSATQLGGSTAILGLPDLALFHDAREAFAVEKVGQPRLELRAAEGGEEGPIVMGELTDEGKGADIRQSPADAQEVTGAQAAVELPEEVGAGIAAALFLLAGAAVPVLEAVEVRFQVVLDRVEQIEGLRLLVEPVFGVGAAQGPSHHVEALFEDGAVSQRENGDGPLWGRLEHRRRLVSKEDLPMLDLDPSNIEGHAGADGVRATPETVENGRWRGRSLHARHASRVGVWAYSCQRPCSIPPRM